MKKDYDENKVFERITPEPAQGLNAEQVSRRMECGAHNVPPQRLTRSAGQIVRDNVFTLFNIINVVLAVLIFSVGSYRNTLFVLVAVSTTFVSIFQELRAKRNIDRLADVVEPDVCVIRDGKKQIIKQEQLVLDDIFIVEAGAQICADGIVAETTGLEVDESALTGESVWVRKTSGDTVYSGSFVVAGGALVRAEAVGDDRYSSRLTQNARREKKPDSELMRSLGSIIKMLTFFMIPIGLLLFCMKYFRVADASFEDAVLGAAAAMIGMIPEGLVLLTGIAFAVGAVNLARARTLVQSMPCIETLARVDVLCLDKTGTITDGKTAMREVITSFGYTNEETALAISAVIWTLGGDNSTSSALKRAFPENPGLDAVSTAPFSSARKWSGASFDGHGSYILGAPEMLFPDRSQELFEIIGRYADEGNRVLAVAHSDAVLSDSILPDGIKPMALVLFSENIRPEAKGTFAFFREEGVEIKVISGDNPVTVSGVAIRAEIVGADKYIDMSTVQEDEPLDDIAREHTVFGRVSPMQKQQLVEALRRAGHVVAMTGDGVNDVPALKAANCSVAMAAGSDAARNVSDLVLLDSNFDAMINIVREGRRVVNNISRVASLYLIKTIYSAVLSVLFLFISLPYPFVPIQLTPVSALTVGIPTFFLALRPNYRRISGRFIDVVLETALPSALCVITSLLIIQGVGVAAKFPFIQTSTMSVMVTGAICFAALCRACLPLDFGKGAMLMLIAASFVVAFTLLGGFFQLALLPTACALLYAPLIAAVYPMFLLFRFLQLKTKSYINKAAANTFSRFRK